MTIESLRVELEGDLDLHTFLGLDPDGHAGYSALRATVELATDAPADVIETLHQRVIATSPVGHKLGRAIPVQIDPA